MKPPASLANSESNRAIVHFLYEPGAGGLDRVAIVLANEMARRGIKTELWLTQLEGPAAGLICDAVTIRAVPSVRFGGRGMKLFLQIPALARMICRHRPVAIFSAGNQSNLTIALARTLSRLSGRSINTKIIQKITNPIIRPGVGGVRAYVRKARFALTAWLGDVCLTLSNVDAEHYARAMPLAAPRFRAIANAYIVPEMCAIGRARLGEVRPQARRLIAVGRLEPQKDHATLLRALGLLTMRDWELRIVGSGPLEAQLRKLAHTLGISTRISFEGFVPNPTRLYADSDILILSSRWEGLPAAVLEAMACGCDIVTTQCSPGLSRVLAPIDNRDVPVGDAQMLAGAIEQALDRTAPIRQLQDIAARYSITASTSEHLAIIDQIVEDVGAAASTDQPR